MNYINCLFAFLFGFGVIQAQTPTELKSMLPEIPGWTIEEEIEVFDSDNLFDRINGSAPLFIENNFREMTAMEYRKDPNYISIHAYRHATPEDAFGMYASERSSELRFFPIGAEAHGDDGNMYFVSGNIYVKMWGSDSNEEMGNTLRLIAEKLASSIAPNAQYPERFGVFPDRGRVPHSETYITSSYIGHEFLKSVYTVNYTESDQPFQLFLIDAKTKENAAEILNKYIDFTKQGGELKEGSIEIKDRYNGDIPCFWKDRYIMGVFSESGETIAAGNALLKEMSDKLP
jgi:hypothetical protein